MILKPKFVFSGFVPNNQSGFNKTFFITQYFYIFGFKILKSKWVGKISFKLSINKDSSVKDVPDMDQRAVLAYHLSKELGVRIPETKLIKFDQIEKHKEILNNLDPLDFNDFTYIPISKCVGRIISDVNLINKKDLLELYIFDCWIGNLDKKIGDYIIDNNNRLWGIDYQLWGPTDNIHRTLGYCGRLYEFTPENLKKYCVARELHQFLLFNKTTATHILKKISCLRQEKVKKIIEMQNFHTFNGQLINNSMIDYLESRRKSIYSDIENIFDIKF